MEVDKDGCSSRKVQRQRERLNVVGNDKGVPRVPKVSKCANDVTLGPIELLETSCLEAEQGMSTADGGAALDRHRVGGDPVDRHNSGACQNSALALKDIDLSENTRVAPDV